TLPHTTEDVQWGNDLLFRIGKKIYCVTCLEPTSPVKLSFKCTPEKFAELVEVEGIIPAPYVAKHHWVALVEMNALRQTEIKDLVRNSYQLVLQKLSKKQQVEFSKRPNKARSPKPRPRPKMK